MNASSRPRAGWGPHPRQPPHLSTASACLIVLEFLPQPTKRHAGEPSPRGGGCLIRAMVACPLAAQVWLGLDFWTKGTARKAATTGDMPQAYAEFHSTPPGWAQRKNNARRVKFTHKPSPAPAQRAAPNHANQFSNSKLGVPRRSSDLAVRMPCPPREIRRSPA